MIKSEKSAYRYFVNNFFRMEFFSTYLNEFEIRINFCVFSYPFCIYERIFFDHISCTEGPYIFFLAGDDLQQREWIFRSSVMGQEA